MVAGEVYAPGEENWAKEVTLPPSQEDISPLKCGGLSPRESGLLMWAVGRR